MTHVSKKLEKSIARLVKRSCKCISFYSRRISEGTELSLHWMSRGPNELEFKSQIFRICLQENAPASLLLDECHPVSSPFREGSRDPIFLRCCTKVYRSVSTRHVGKLMPVSMKC
jgi:hypothetical protein